MDAEGSVLQHIQNGLPTRTVIDVETRIAISVQIGLHVLDVVKHDSQNARVLETGAAGLGKIPEFHLLGQPLVHEVAA